MENHKTMKQLHVRAALVAFPSLLAASVLTSCGDAGSDASDMEAATTDEGAHADAATAMDAGALVLANANDAAADELSAALEAIPGAADAIVGARPFARPSELHAALTAAVGEEAARQAYEKVWVPMDLNSADRDEILLIPGLGDRMAHEFEEYRPYVDMDQFRREIGKYVDEDEVARLERYVTIK